MGDVIVSFGKLSFAVDNFQGSLYHQKHAFYFRKVKQWKACLWVSASEAELHHICGLT